MIPQDHPLASRQSLSLKDLANEPIIMLKNDPESSKFTIEKMAECGFVPKQIVYADQFESVAFTIRETNGVFVTGNCLKKVTFLNVANIPIDDEKMVCEIAFAYKSTNPNPAIPLFVKYAATPK